MPPISIGSRNYRIGQTEILLAPNSSLPVYQEQFPRYDRALSLIAKLVLEKYPAATAIDIGANSGDTAAAMRCAGPIPVLCIEGSAEIIPILQENARRLGGEIAIVQAYIGSGEEEIAIEKIAFASATSSARHAVVAPHSGGTRAKSLAEIVASYPSFATARLLKTDTDGFDYKIIDGSLDFIAKSRPVIFYEYQMDYRTDLPAMIAEALQSLKQLISIGYKRFVVYDNFGHLIGVFESDLLPLMEQLTYWLYSNRVFGPAVYLLDIAAFHGDDLDLCASLVAAEREAIVTASNELRQSASPSASLLNKLVARVPSRAKLRFLWGRLLSTPALRPVAIAAVKGLRRLRGKPA